jgi:DNA-binding NtrC family response regulator
MTRVLIVEDDSSYADMLGRKVSSLGHETWLASRLADVVAAVEDFSPALVLLDVHLPDGSGLSLIERLKEMPSHPEVIIVTGRGDCEGAECAIRAGAWDYVCKGSLTHVTVAIQRALAFREQQASAPIKVLDACGILGRSAALRQTFNQLLQAANTGSNVLITGESGTGKELVALAIHRNSRRCGKGFVVVDCATLTESLADSTLFGHKKGSFTGAVDTRMGLFEQANQGTLFLDEVGEMSLAVQKTFLRVLQERRFRPVGGDHELEVDFRLLAATNKDLDRMVAEGTFRQDLLFRLRSLTLNVPPLRDRLGDVREIASAYVARTCEREGLGTKGISPEFFEAIERYPWPGNVRELTHAIEFAVASALNHHTLYATHLPTEIRIHSARSRIDGAHASSATVAEASLHALNSSEGKPSSGAPCRTLREVRDAATVRYLGELLRHTGGDIDRTCAIAGLSRSRLYALLKEFSLRAPD